MYVEIGNESGQVPRVRGPVKGTGPTEADDSLNSGP